jgi:signal transduction histidine kinase
VLPGPRWLAGGPGGWPGLLVSRGDPRLAERLVANLADNAIRYNAPGGRVDITAGRRDDRACLAVTNTGPVIPPDQLGRLFQPFQRLAEGRRTESGHTEPRRTEPRRTEPRCTR